MKTSKTHRIRRRILENTVVYTKADLSELTLKELVSMQDKLLIKLLIKQKFHNRNNQKLWN